MISEKHLIINLLGGTSEPAHGQVRVEKDTVPQSPNTHPSVYRSNTRVKDSKL